MGGFHASPEPRDLAGMPAPRQRDLDRRTLMRLAAASGASVLLASCGDGGATREGGLRPLRKTVRFEEKTDLILLTDRPPQLETPLRFFREDFTPNDAFYVRSHLAGIPVSVDTRSFRLNVGGHVERPLAISLHELRTAFTPVSIVAVNQCSGNGRSLFEPRVPGGQWANGAVGNARWTGVRLKDLLARAGIKAGAAQVSFQGLDRPVLPGTPAFIKALDVDQALGDDILVAYAMNGAPLPMLNGFPMRLVVPGWYATYWVKALSEIQVLPKRFSGFWMDKAYRIPKAADAQESPDHLATETVPINRLSVRSLFVRPEPDEVLRMGVPCEIEGLAMDSGRGIARVEVSTDGAATWSEAQLDPELGRYSWRRWRSRWTPGARGPQRLFARATNSAGESQTLTQWNRSGYARNVIEQLAVTVV